MLTRIAVTKKNNKTVQITLTDNSEYIYEHTICMAHTVVEYGARITELNPYGTIVANVGNNYDDFSKYIDKYICDKYVVEETYYLDVTDTKTYYV